MLFYVIMKAIHSNTTFEHCKSDKNSTSYIKRMEPFDFCMIKKIYFQILIRHPSPLDVKFTKIGEITSKNLPVDIRCLNF